MPRRQLRARVELLLGTRQIHGHFSSFMCCDSLFMVLCGQLAIKRTVWLDQRSGINNARAAALVARKLYFTEDTAKYPSLPHSHHVQLNYKSFCCKKCYNDNSGCIFVCQRLLCVILWHVSLQGALAQPRLRVTSM